MALICWTGSPREAHGLLSQHFAFNKIEHVFAHLDSLPQFALGRAIDPDSDVVLAMGTKALNKFQAIGVVPKNRALGSQRGKVFKSPNGVSTLFTYDPQLIHLEADKPTEIIWDANLSSRLMKHGTLRPQIGKYEWGSLHNVRHAVRNEIAKHGHCVLSLDLETHGLFPWYDDKHIVTSQWSWEPGTATVVDHYQHDGCLSKAEQEDFEWLITNPRIFLWGANLKYDSVWIRKKWGVWILNFTFDTTLAGSIQSENRSNSLNNHTKIYVPDLGGYDDEFNSHADKGEMPSEMAKDPEAFCDYAGGDGDACLQVGRHIQKELGADHQLKRFYQKILHPAARAFERIEYRGLLVDTERMQEVKAQVGGDVVDLTHKTMMAIPLEVRAKYADNLSLTRPDLIRDAMFSKDGFGLTPHKDYITPKTKKPSTAMNHLKMFSGDENAKPFLDSLSALNSATKTLSTYIDGFLKHLRPDGHFHPTYALHHGALFEGKGDTGTVSGRLTAKDPSINTLPKHTIYTKLLRSCYPAPPGYDFWQLDYSQGELRVAAELSDEDNMIQVYLDGGDLHSKTAAELNDYSYEDFMALKISNKALYSELRQGGKAGNFGLLYAMGARGFVAYAYKEYGVVMSLQKAMEFRNNFFLMYPRLLEWHDESIEHVMQFKQIRTPLGRLRHLPLIDSPKDDVRAKAERQAINSPVQSTLNDICLHLVGLIEERYGKDEEEFSVRGSSHDALYGYVRAGDHEKWFQSVQAIVDEQHEIFKIDFDWEPRLRFPVDWEIGTRWDNLTEYKLAA